MMVYGDPRYRISSHVFLSRFSERLRQTRADNLGDLRTLLIQAGQFEQAMVDAGFDASRRTDLAAEAFYKRLKAEMPDLSALNRIDEGPDVTLTVKIPEGYEFYALYPEQYIAAAETLAKERPQQRALVVGIRSIGTSLSAVVRSALPGSRRCTVRPEGHPFQRRGTLPSVTANQFHFAVIVDEGPGLSGSSVVAVYDALRSAGFSQIIIFPGHANGPGPASSQTIRDIWAKAEKRFSAPPPLPGRDLGAGKWRELISGEWPPAFVSFERPKYLSREGVLWKFAGLGAAYENGNTGIENARERIEALSTEGFGPRTIDSKRGFIGTEWIDGARLTKADARDPAVLDLASQYIVRFPGLPLDPEDMSTGQQRLAEMTVANTREALGDKWAQVARHKLHRGCDPQMFQSYGDGRLTP